MSFENWLKLNKVSLIIFVLISYIPSWVTISLIWQIFDKNHVNLTNFIFIQILTIFTLSLTIYFLHAFYGMTEKDPLYDIKTTAITTFTTQFEKMDFIPFVGKRNLKKKEQQEMLRLNEFIKEYSEVPDNPNNFDETYKTKLKIAEKTLKEINFEILPQRFLTNWQNLKTSAETSLATLQLKEQERQKQQKIIDERKREQQIAFDKRLKEKQIAAAKQQREILEEEKRKTEALNILKMEESKIRKERIDTEYDIILKNESTVEQIQRFIYSRLQDLSKSPQLLNKDSTNFETVVKQLQDSFDSDCAVFTEYLIKHGFIKNNLEISENKLLVIQLVDKESEELIRKMIQRVDEYKSIQLKNRDLEYEIVKLKEKREEEIRLFKKSNITLSDIEAKNRDIAKLIDNNSFGEHLGELIRDYESWDVGQEEGSYYCNICRKEITFEDLANGSMSSCPHCTNKFHRTHFLEVLKVSGNCPACRKKVTQDQIV